MFSVPITFVLIVCQNTTQKVRSPKICNMSYAPFIRLLTIDIFKYDDCIIFDWKHMEFGNRPWQGCTCRKLEMPGKQDGIFGQLQSTTAQWHLWVRQIEKWCKSGKQKEIPHALQVTFNEKPEKKQRNTMSNKLKSRVANPLFQVILRSGEVVISNNNLKSQETECHVIATNIIKNRPIHY